MRRAPIVIIALCVAFASSNACKARDNPRGSETDTTQSGGGDTATQNSSAVGESMGERIVIDQVAMHVVESGDRVAIELYPRVLGQELGRFLLSSPLFAGDASLVKVGYRPRRADVHVQIQYDVEAGDRTSAAQAVITAQAWMEWEDAADAPAPGTTLVIESAIAQEQRANTDGFIAETVAHAIARIGHELIAKEQIRTGGLDALSDGLRSTDMELVVWTLTLIAERGTREMFEPVLAKLASEDTSVRDHAVAALVAIGDHRAVDPLTKHAAFYDHPFMEIVIDAVTELGGTDAHPYLAFIASGHPRSDIRERAANGLARLEKRAPSGL